MKYIIIVQSYSGNYNIGPFDYDVQPIVDRINKSIWSIKIQADKVWNFMHSSLYLDNSEKTKEIKAIKRVLSAKTQVISQEERLRLKNKLNTLERELSVSNTKQSVVDFAKSNNFTSILPFLTALPDVFSDQDILIMMKYPRVYVYEIKSPDEKTENFWDKIIHKEIKKGKS